MSNQHTVIETLDELAARILRMQKHCRSELYTTAEVANYLSKNHTYRVSSARAYAVMEKLRARSLVSCTLREAKTGKGGRAIKTWRKRDSTVRMSNIHLREHTNSGLGIAWEGAGR